jgi:hypothetical protein
MAKASLTVVVLVLVAFLHAREPRAQPAQKAPGVAVRVVESHGIRRNEYPVRATVDLPQGAIADASRARLLLGTADVAAQYTATSAWPDGSVRSLDVDFNASFAPLESREYRVEYGAAVTRSAPAGRGGLTVTEDADTIQAGNIKFNKRGVPLILSANYRGEFIGKGDNGLFVTDTTGVRHGLASAQSLTVTLLKRGPLVVAIRYEGNLPIGAGPGVPFLVALEMPNSKSWLKWTVDVHDPDKRVKSIDIATPFAFGGYPWLWDLGTESDSYGAIRNATEGMSFTQVAGPVPAGKALPNWRIETRVQGAMRVYETSQRPFERGDVAQGWGHFQGSTAAVAFAIGRFGALERFEQPEERAGTHTISFDGQGQASFSFAKNGSSPYHRLVVYQHFVSTPVPIGAVTSPASMVQPPTVTIGKP